jgi:hypothetical protein
MRKPPGNRGFSLFQDSNAVVGVSAILSTGRLLCAGHEGYCEGYREL